MKNKNILFILHRLYYEGKTKEGGIDFFARFFREKKYHIYIIEHALEDFNYPSRLIINRKITKKYPLNSKPPIRWGKELLLNRQILKDTKVKFKYAYASDALNFLSLYWAKKRKMIDKIFFHCTDFSMNRFKNPVLNKIYQHIFRFSLKHADMTNVVTNHVKKMAQKLAPKAKIILIPNSPLFAAFPRLKPEEKNKNQLVITISQMTKRSNFDAYLKIIRLVKQSISDIKLTIIGSVDDYIKKQIKINKLNQNIVYTGLLPYNKAILEVAKGYIGIVYYPKNIDHVRYGDSIKLREYAAAGLPGVSDNITSTSLEMSKYKAGFACQTVFGVAKNIIKLINDQKLYLQMHRNALLWAKKMDKEKILEQIFSEI